MRSFLVLLFSTILIAMILITTHASLDRTVSNVGKELLSDRWFQATLCDAYFGFITVYIWVWYRERTFLARSVWFILIMLLGNIAISIYVLIQIWLLPGNASLCDLMKRRSIGFESN